MKKNILYLIVLIFPLLSQSQKLPSELIAVLNHHGGIDTWNTFQTLGFERGNNIKHLVDLKSRTETILTPKGKIGFDGENYWKTTAKGNPKFMVNLHFYFLAMPFVLADSGIQYTLDVPNLEHNGISYPGIKISYNSGVGVADKDNYILYYHPETFQMEWLAYTVTFGKQQPSKKYSLKKYENWKDVNGLLLPTKIQSYKHQNFKVSSKKGNPLWFKTIIISSQKAEKKFFVKH